MTLGPKRALPLWGSALFNSIGTKEPAADCCHPRAVAASAASEWGHTPSGNAGRIASALPQVQILSLRPRRRGLCIVRDDFFVNFSEALHVFVQNTPCFSLYVEGLFVLTACKGEDMNVL